LISELFARYLYATPTFYDYKTLGSEHEKRLINRLFFG